MRQLGAAAVSGADASQEAMNPGRWRPTIPGESRRFLTGEDAKAAIDRALKAARAASAARAEGQGLPARTWAAMPMRTRVVVVMLASAEDEDPRTVAQRPWEGLAEGDRAKFAAVARELRRDLSSAASLF